MGIFLSLAVGLWGMNAHGKCGGHLLSSVFSKQAAEHWLNLEERGQFTLVDRIEDLVDEAQNDRWSPVEIRRQLRFLLQNLLNGHVLPTDDEDWVERALRELAHSKATDFRVRERLENLITRASF